MRTLSNKVTIQDKDGNKIKEIKANLMKCNYVVFISKGTWDDSRDIPVYAGGKYECEAVATKLNQKIKRIKVLADELYGGENICNLPGDVITSLYSRYNEIYNINSAYVEKLKYYRT